MQKYQVGEVALGNSQITIWPTRFYLPIGCGFLVLMLLYKAWRLFAGDNSVLAEADDRQDDRLGRIGFPLHFPSKNKIHAPGPSWMI